MTEFRLSNYTNDEQKILKKRAQNLASEFTQQEGTKQEFLICKISNEQYGFESQYIQEVFLFDVITPLPACPEWLPGITNVRGEIVSVIDLRQFFDLPIHQTSKKQRAVILHDEEIKFGILIDEILGVFQIEQKSITSEFATFDDIRKSYLIGLTKENFILLDSKKLLNDPKLIISDDI